MKYYDNIDINEKIFFNFFFLQLTGIILIAVGATIKSNYKEYDTFLDGKYFSLPNLLIATGVLIFIISFLGCYGAIKENWIILMAVSFFEYYTLYK